MRPRNEPFTPSDARSDTPRSTERLLRALDAPRNSTFEMHYNRAAREIDLPLLVAYRDPLLNHPKLRGHVRDHLLHRLEWAELPTNQLWDELLRVGHALGNAYLGQFNTSESDALVEILGRRGESLQG